MNLGIYIRNGNDWVKREFHGIGMRVEDDLLLTESEAEVLTDECVKYASDIEILMKRYLIQDI